MFIFAMTNPLVYPTVGVYIMLIVIMSLVLFKPYKNKWHTVIDVVLFSAYLHIFLMVIFYREGMMVDPVEVYGLRKSIYNPIGYVSISIILLYGLILLVARIFPMKPFGSFLKSKIKNITKESSLPYRIEHEQEEKCSLLTK